NFVYKINKNSGEVKWHVSFRAPIRGNGGIIGDNLTILTVDNCLHVINIQDGNSVWTYQNGINEIIGSYDVSPAILDNMIIAPFSNGELIAFDEEGKKLWSKKLSINILDTQLTDIITTPKIHNDIVVAANNSYVYAFNVKSGNVLWSKQLQVKSMSNIESNYSPLIKKQREGGRVFIITKDNEIIGLDVRNGEVIWSSDLIKKMQLKSNTYFSSAVYAHTLWILSSSGFILAFPGFDNGGKIIKIPEGVFHLPVFKFHEIFFTTKQGGVFSLENKFVLYD
ncbi:PQQ-binding-like beta-propeller repeat protein, partial [Wolbachia endosymbiont of Pentidionis agamae]|uniref:PQQ-binding-like beta-propeller repeat protein n=1 Tax=Wolbachia endosymbiont of Pentidionis agamae TaxID=3110435 RepID=UPI002FD3F0FB